jgi:hypothetical protein
MLNHAFLYLQLSFIGKTLAERYCVLIQADDLDAGHKADVTPRMVSH